MIVQIWSLYNPAIVINSVDTKKTFISFAFQHSRIKLLGEIPRDPIDSHAHPHGSSLLAFTDP